MSKSTAIAVLLLISINATGHAEPLVIASNFKHSLDATLSEVVVAQLVPNGRTVWLEERKTWCLEDRKRRACVRFTDGSRDNLKLLERGEVHYALAQQDVVGEYLSRFEIEQEGDSAVQIVGAIYDEYLHLLIRSPFRLSSAHDLAGLRVWYGREGSGTRATAERFLDAVGVVPVALHADSEALSEIPSSNILDFFRERQLDAAMIMAIAGRQTICTGILQGSFSVHPLQPETIRQLTSERLGATFRRDLSLAAIPAETYGETQPDPVPTVAIPVLLLARYDRPAPEIRRVFEAAKDAWPEAVEFQPGIEPGIGRSDCTIPRAYSDTIVSSSLPLHPAIRQPSWLERAFTAIDPVALVVIVLFVGGLVVLLQLARRSSRTWQRRLRRLIRRQTPLIIFLVFIGSMAMITLATYMVEKKYNENFSTLIESWWSITLYLLSGLEDRVPYTPLGRLFATIGLVAGPTFFAFLTSWLTKSFIIRERNMPSRMRDHILLLNWTDRAAELIEELKDSREHTKEKYEILVLGDQTSLDSLDSRRVIQDRREIAFEGFFFLLGDPTDQEALRQAKADSAHTVLILADDRLDVAADERTIRSIIMLRRLAQENNETIHVVAEVVNPANHAILEDLADGFPGLLEPITGLKVRACLLAQAALNKGVVSFYEDLLRTSGETNEIYISPLPFDVAGTPFREYAARVIADAPLPVIPVGVQRNYNGRAEIFCNPRDGQPGSILRIGDCLVMIAFEPVEEDILPSGRLREGNVE